MVDEAVKNSFLCKNKLVQSLLRKAMEAREMVQQLRTFAALPQSLSLVPTTNTE